LKPALFISSSASVDDRHEDTNSHHDGDQGKQREKYTKNKQKSVPDHKAQSLPHHTLRHLRLLFFAVFCALFYPVLADGQSTVAPFLSPVWQFMDNSGNPLSGGKVCTFSAGTSTPLATYSEGTGTTPNANPVILDSAGRATIYLTSAAYKIVVAASTANSSCVPALSTADPVSWATPLTTFTGIADAGVFNITQPTAATSGANQSSFASCLHGNYWTGAASADDKWCLSDVLGTGSNPSSTYTLTHSGSSGAATLSIPSTIQAVTAQDVNGVKYAATYVSGSTTCGIAEAYAALPSGGGKIVLQQGNCSASGWPVTISKPIVLEGQGMGGPTDPGTNATLVAGSYLTNTSTGNTFFNISLGTGTSLEGVTFRDFAMIGNKVVGGATAGDCVDINGGTSAQQVRAIRFDNIQCNQPKGSGFVIQDNAFMITFTNVHVDQPGSHCLVLKDGPNSGVNSQIRVIASTFDLCGGTNGSILPGTADGINISGSTSRAIDFQGSTAADSANGIKVATGATNTQLHITNSDFETNTVADVNLNDGYGHTIFGSTLLGAGAATGRGVLTAMPGGANFVNTQLLMWANNISGHATQEVTIGAAQHLCFILPQAQNNYTFTDSSNTCVKLDVDSNGALLFTGLGGFLPNADGTYSAGSSAKAWLNIYHWRQFIHEFNPLTAATGFDACYGDPTLHGRVCNDNNTVFTPVGSRAILTADWTCGTAGTVASCVAATIIGSGGGVPWTFTLPLVANSLQLDCDGVVGQATAATANNWNLITATNGATNVTAFYDMFTATGTKTSGATTDQASTTTTFTVGGTWTLGGTATKMPFHIHASIEAASASGTVLSVQLVAPTVADLVTIYRGSGCWIHP
jgi:hypothetical protein